MISLTIQPIPDILVGNEELWGIEFEIAINSAQQPSLRYRNDEIRQRLRLETHGKCAYCESHIEHVSYSHIEHIVPKHKVPRLVCTWSNLTLACQVCNTEKGDYLSVEAPLLNPYIDDVENLIWFDGPMAIKRSDQAHLTISTLKLNRPALLFKRYERLESINRILGLIERSSGNQALVNALCADLMDALKDAAEYASCSRRFTNAECAHRGIALA